MAREQLSQMILKKGLVTTETQQNSVLYLNRDLDKDLDVGVHT